MKEKKDSCVEFNIYVDCGKCSRSEDLCDSTCKKDEDGACVRINIFVDCDDKCKYTL